MQSLCILSSSSVLDRLAHGSSESFNGGLRDEIPQHQQLRVPLTRARVVISGWKNEYNHRREHSALSYQTPAGHDNGLISSGGGMPAAGTDSSTPGFACRSDDRDGRGVGIGSTIPSTRMRGSRRSRIPINQPVKSLTLFRRPPATPPLQLNQ
ncbi:integrase core domain-containing protein [Nocardia nepalensis]|uniref:integrase core domain-containing protein n=1 Tax=Nocardia nepalensis TaxID=3375448 RepID=UPI003B66FEBC